MEGIEEVKQMLIELLHEVRNRREASPPAPPPPLRKRERSRSPPPTRRESDVEVFIANWGDVVEKQDVENWMRKRYGKDCITESYVHPSNDWGKITMANNEIQTQVLNDIYYLAREFGWQQNDIRKGKLKVRR
jgi:hypothetical protein